MVALQFVRCSAMQANYSRRLDVMFEYETVEHENVEKNVKNRVQGEIREEGT